MLHVMSSTVANVLETNRDSGLANTLLGIEGLEGDLLVLGLIHRELDGLAELCIFVIGGCRFLNEGRSTVG